MEKLDTYDGFWRDLVNKGNNEEKAKYLNNLIQNQTNQLKQKGKTDDKEFQKKIIQLAKEERSNLKKST